MVHKILFWSGFGVAVRLWQLGIEMRPFFNKESLWVYPLFAGIGGSFGYWMQGIEYRQSKFLTDRREALLEKRRRVAEQDAPNAGSEKQRTQDGAVATPDRKIPTQESAI